MLGTESPLWCQGRQPSHRCIQDRAQSCNGCFAPVLSLHRRGHCVLSLKQTYTVQAQIAPISCTTRAATTGALATRSSQTGMQQPVMFGVAVPTHVTWSLQKQCLAMLSNQVGGHLRQPRRGLWGVLLPIPLAFLLVVLSAAVFFFKYFLLHFDPRVGFHA